MTNLTRVDDDDRAILMWLHQRPAKTQKAYRSDIAQFRSIVGVPLRQVKLEDLQRYLDELQQRQLKPASCRRKVNAVKSLYSYLIKLGYIQVNPTAVIQLPKAPNQLANRLLSKTQVQHLLAAAEPGRNAALMRFMYATGMRVSEVCSLTWRDFQERADGQIQVTVVGKGSKVRTVIVPHSVWREVGSLRAEAAIDTAVFGIQPTQVWKIVKAAARSAGLDERISCHWLRHANAQHSLLAGAPIHVVRDSLGHSSIAVTNTYLEATPGDSSSKYLGL